MAAPVVRDRLIANESGSAEAAAHIKVLTDLFSVFLLSVYRH